MPRTIKKRTTHHDKENFLSRTWRGVMAYTYILICLFDFVIGPLVYFWVQQFETQAANDAYREWKSITLQSGGLFHLAMGGILGVSSWGKSQERMAVSTPMMDMERPMGLQTPRMTETVKVTERQEL